MGNLVWTDDQLADLRAGRTLPSARASLTMAVQSAIAGQFEQARTWTMIATELRAGSEPAPAAELPEARTEMFEAVIRTDAAREAYVRAATEHQAVTAEVSATQRLVPPYVEHHDAQCLNCGQQLIFRTPAAPNTGPPRWLHRSNYQELCPVQPESGGRWFARPVRDDADQS